MKRPPVSAMALAALGFAAIALAIVLLTKGCTIECYERVVAAVFLAWGALGLAALLPNAYGLGSLCGALTLGVFIGMVFLFATAWVGFIPPLLLVALAVYERASIKRYYLRAAP